MLRWTDLAGNAGNMQEVLPSKRHTGPFDPTVSCTCHVLNDSDLGAVLECSDSERNATIFKHSYIKSANPSSKHSSNCISLWINLQKSKD